VRCLRRLAVYPPVVPEAGRLTIPKLDCGAGSEQCHFTIGYSQRQTVPWLDVVDPLVPLPSEAQGLVEPIKVHDVEAAQALRPRDPFPVYKAVAMSRAVG
jgi:hypothetical protein